MKQHIKAGSSPGKGMEKKRGGVPARILTGRKNGCPSGYRCRTRHPEGLVVISPGSFAGAGAAFERSQVQGRNEKRAQLYPAEAKEPGEPVRQE
ncbi:hypothetical protein [Mucilaginibacter celer]|uniref:Uncharacterized protein n=1 Tax=Mucilaginibacter celer TaxID=2305508 RepID=A0A494VHW6_9SPHI|nr:hypothetical protein [Mucilaginibacter celer]AYL94376.1 hypothetical protein HYN43_003265 [Mucilaginibacter celer]